MPGRDYDVAVIGGGSGGLSAATEAAKHGAKVVIFDYVTPTNKGTKWGFGGTCVNVGCIPKKLMHYAASLKHNFEDAPHYGWAVETTKFDWATCVNCVQSTVKRLNFQYRSGMRKRGIAYINALAKFADAHTLEYEESGEVKRITASHIIIAVGGRPLIPTEIKNAAEYGITSDDIFSLPSAPGKVLLVGASYIALECAGFLTGLGFDTTVAVRSIPLRSFDQQCAAKIIEIMNETGTKFLHKTTVISLEKLPTGRIKVAFSGGIEADEYDTVMFASGRVPNTAALNLRCTGVETASNGKIKVDVADRTSTVNIYAIGDCAEGRKELTPVAIKAGELLMRRIFANSDEVMDQSLIPTTVFTPMEYGCVGLSEEEARLEYGDGDVEVFLQEHKTLEVEAAHREKVQAARKSEFDTEISNPCLAKLVCLKSADMKIVGFHYVGPHAGETTMGFAVAIRLGAKKRDFDTTVGIHPTDAEAFANLSIAKSSGLPFQMQGCGGGRCG